MSNALIIAAAGKSERFGSVNKLLAPLGDVPVICHALINLGHLFPAGRRILILNEAERDNVMEAIRSKHLDDGWQVALGGSTRAESIANGLASVPLDTELVAIHDAARPLANAALMQRCLDVAAVHGAAIAAHRITDTIKVADSDGRCMKTADRTRLWGAETPQVIRLDWLLDAFTRCPGAQFTDEAQRLEMAGYCPVLVENRNCNLKLTYQEDLSFLSKLL